ncbi:MAG TPA: phosphate signaling complex protein PhoU [Thermoanaerobaculaceae bacterium]|nr:phosphate signaling complex protein PhoU [Thermoanaerobaculaceae bacterium]
MVDRPLEHDLEELKKLLLTMAGEVERQLGRAIQALVERDSRIAEEVIAGDSLIDQREVEVDHKVIELIVRARPMARDLRLVMTAIKIAPDLERVADHAVGIARQAMELNRVPPLKAFITIPRMAEKATSMVRDAIGAFVASDSQLARQVIDRDAEVDWEFEQIFRELLTYMMEDPKTIRRALALLMVSRALERIGDHGTNISEQVVYLVEAEDIRHRHSDGADGE